MSHAFSSAKRLVFWAAQAVFAVTVATAIGACALTSKAEQIEIRYFSPERAALQRNDAASTSGATVELRLGRVSSGSNLRERIAYRATAYELGYYDDLRWTERPEIYVRRALSRSLFEAHGFHRALGGAAPTLDIEVIAFDELRLDAPRAARIELKVILYANEGVLFERTLLTDRRVLGDATAMENVVAAMAQALDAAAEGLALDVQKVLAARQPPHPSDSLP